MNETLKLKLSGLPAEPGVYLFRDAAAALLYVGKACSLKSRVRSYFGRTRDQRLAARFIEKNVADLEFIVTRSEKEALLLESSLIKKLKPRYNLRLRDDKSFLNLRLDPRDPFPRIVPTRQVRRDGALYFGPYPGTRAIRMTLRFLRSFVPLRDCKDADFQSRTRPCLEHEIGRCSAPCVGLRSQAEYARDVERAVRILRGETTELVLLVEKEMQEAARREQFERAAALRDYLQSIAAAAPRAAETGACGDLDAVGVWREGGLTQVVVLFVRQGRLVDRAAFTLQQELPEDELLAQFLQRFYEGGRPVPAEILLPGEAYGRAALAQWLAERRGSRARLWAPRRGEKARLVELARENARLSLHASSDRRERAALLLEELRARLDLRRVPVVIDCVDVSTTGGKETVASCVQFRHGEPHKASYRRFRIKQADPQDEYASLREVLSRRGLRARAEQSFPDLLIVDGGRGQWNAARAVLDGLGAQHVDLIGLAKGARRGRGLVLKQGEEERIYTRGAGDPLVLEQVSPLNMFLQRVRDEAHRFAIAYHRQRRGRRSLASELDAIPLLGPRRKQILLERCGDLEGIRRASEAELAALPGIGARVAREIARHFGR
ncbi:MAG: excinuclease ABC subunit UvrC [Planctomycetes bacterium]|nr:excinuclease ABC subunit UvrC [Planctomycetota bacterium]